jgi:hypothetical protein
VKGQSQHEVLTDFHLPPFLSAGILENQWQMKKNLSVFSASLLAQ